jgi:hypothetical protein
MSRYQRDVVQLIRDAGGTGIRVTPGGRHLHVHYVLDGQPRRHLMRRGTHIAPRVLVHLTAELRRHRRNGSSAP